MTTPTRSSNTAISLCFLMVIAGAAATHAGGALETVDITGRVPSPTPGQFVAKVIGIKWDTRAIPVQYSMNNTLDPIPVPAVLGAPVLTLAAAATELQVSLDAWNTIKTSFIRMQITGTTANPGLRGFDFVNELTFRTAATFTAIASSPSVSLIEDTTLVDGDLIDGDLDSDVSSAISVVTDVDGDGDLEFPAGFYKAGTILDNDVQFNTKDSNGFRFTVGDAAADTITRSVDLGTVAVHEFGHSHGLSHSLNNQNSASDGSGATMFPFIDTGDPAAELAQRTVDADDIAYSSYFYQEGTANSGPAALQSGDIAFRKVFGLIKGELRHGELDQPLAGGNVFTINDKTGTASTSAFSGTTQLSYDPVSGALNLVDPAFNIVDGNYVIPVTKGKYRVGIEPVDGAPVPDTSVSFTTQIGFLFGQHGFNEEFPDLDSHHDGFGTEDTVSVNAGHTEHGVDMTTSDVVNIDNFGNRNFVGFTAPVPGRYYAVRISAEQFTEFAAGRHLDFKAMAFDTFVVDASVAPIYAASQGRLHGRTPRRRSIGQETPEPHLKPITIPVEGGDDAASLSAERSGVGRSARRVLDRIGAPAGGSAGVGCDGGRRPGAAARTRRRAWSGRRLAGGECRSSRDVPHPRAGRTESGAAEPRRHPGHRRPRRRAAGVDERR